MASIQGGRGEVPGCGFTTPREAAREVLAAARAAGYGGLSPLPFNRFAQDETTWWLSPSSRNPAYKHGKIIFTRQAAAPGDMFVGLYVEKGVGSMAAAAYRDTVKGRRYIMDSTWLWHHFFAALGSEKFAQVAGAAERESGHPVTIAIDAALVPPPAGRDDVHSPELPRDVVRFEFSRGELRFIDSETPAGLLVRAGESETLAGLATRISRILQLDWVWVDFLAGLRFTTAPGSDTQSMWSARDVWEKACRPWRAWLQ